VIFKHRWRKQPQIAAYAIFYKYYQKVKNLKQFEFSNSTPKAYHRFSIVNLKLAHYRADFSDRINGIYMISLFFYILIILYILSKKGNSYTIKLF
ncbi:MAG: hypothetical protein LWW98_06400, partial [Deltaproteobacteria bacterium]|nr:hypothetical protein [Deltaproteobacteria bacterium]